MNNTMKRHRWLAVRCLLIALAVTSLSGIAQAGAVEEATVRSVVETWVRLHDVDGRPDATVERIEAHSKGELVVAYIAHLNDSGFCICGADDRILPIYMYSPGGRYEDAPDAFVPILEEISSRIESVIASSGRSDFTSVRIQEIAGNRPQYWASVSRGRIPQLSSGSDLSIGQMELPLTTKWRQGGPYNDYCPWGNGGRTVAGCVAIAGAQVARYWNWPPSGSTTYGYNWDGDDSCDPPHTGGSYLSADFTDPYDWTNMPDQCWSSSSQAQRSAVAELCYEIGVGSKMDYGHCGSGAQLDRLRRALEVYLGYDGDAEELDREWDSFAEIRTEIQYLRPVVFSGFNASGVGHAWVIYGYRSTSPVEFLMNMGHGSATSRVWYTMDNCPYPSSQQYIRFITPTTVKCAWPHHSGDGTPNDPYGSVEEAISEAPNGSTIVFRAGYTYDCGGGSLVVSKPLTLKGHQVVLQ